MSRKPETMTYKFKVSLPGIKGFSREYLVNERNSLYHFHKQMLSDMEFPIDQIVLFKGFDALGNLVARYATLDMGDGSIDRVSVAHAVAAGITEFTYFYDTTNKKSVIVTLMGPDDSKTDKPVLIFEKGPIPEEFLNGYVAFEDLPPEKRVLQPAEGDDSDIDDEDGIDDESEDADGEEYGIEEGEEEF